MRTWLSKTNGYVTEKPNDSFTGVFTNSGEKIYEGDLITVTRITKRYIGKYNKYNCVSESEYNNPKNWKIEEKRYTGKVYYLGGRFFIDLPTDGRISEFANLYGPAPRLEIYHGMTGERMYGFYHIELV